MSKYCHLNQFLELSNIFVLPSIFEPEFRPFDKIIPMSYAQWPLIFNFSKCFCQLHSQTYQIF